MVDVCKIDNEVSSSWSFAFCSTAVRRRYDRSTTYVTTVMTFDKQSSGRRIEFESKSSRIQVVS